MPVSRLLRDVVVKFNLRGVTNVEQSLALLTHMKTFGTVTSFTFGRDPLTLQRTGMATVIYLHMADCQASTKKQHQTVPGLPTPFNTIQVSKHIKKSRPQDQLR
ncbi:hypothetical protein GGF40_002474 [Coemansia sp. RSA 1286]|nr:hypothetical protein IWW45_003457 [Coemansia sp. RSA 485]KAJ2600016.1 hypothetical protein GGF39_001971 [Coemansia sp. RSA 1721]KAJ2637264.1 hypothetical protein GGF40_002474 [Coemansia sp. RSA 1286]